MAVAGPLFYGLQMKSAWGFLVDLDSAALVSFLQAHAPEAVLVVFSLAKKRRGGLLRPFFPVASGTRHKFMSYQMGLAELFSPLPFLLRFVPLVDAASRDFLLLLLGRTPAIWQALTRRRPRRQWSGEKLKLPS